MGLELKGVPDGFGFIYGRYVDDAGDSWRVDVLPPLPLWRGQIKLESTPPHPTDWIVYVDGEEIARVRRRDDLDAVVGRHLAIGKD